MSVVFDASSIFSASFRRWVEAATRFVSNLTFQCKSFSWSCFRCSSASSCSAVAHTFTLFMHRVPISRCTSLCTALSVIACSRRASHSFAATCKEAW